MENLTQFNNTSFTFRRGIWINDFAFVWILLTISLYLLVALVYHQVKVEKPLEEKFFRLTVEKKFRALSKYTCIVIGIFSTVLCFSDVGLRSVEWNAVFSHKSKQSIYADEIACNVLPHISASAICFGNVFVYIFLWLRQSIFYVHPSLKILYNNKLKAFSVSVLILYLLLGLFLFFAHSVIARYALNKAGFCVAHVNIVNDALYLQLLFSWNILSIVMQVLLLGLFIYPLVKQSSWHKNQQGMQNNRLLQLVIKAVILASVCLVTDIGSLVSLGLVYGEDTNNPSFLYTSNLVINYLVTIACFSIWKKLFWPWRVQCRYISSVTNTDEISSVSQQRTFRRSSFRAAPNTSKI